ncbi:MAG: PKD domain-containing protein [Candidatus Thorarchaeota archaeon]
MKKSNILLILAIFISSGVLFCIPTAIHATLPLEHNTGWQWEINNNDTLIYYIEDNVMGSRYEAYNFTGEPWVSSGFLDVLNITKLKFNQQTGSIENSGEIFQCAASLAPGFWQLSFYDGGVSTGGLTMAFPLIPVNTSGLINQTQLDDWGTAMTNNLGGTTYASALQLQEYVVVGDNELHLYNSTSTILQYVNMTYNNNGILETAYVQLEFNMGGPIILEQTITRKSGDVDSLLNPIDETTVAVNVGDSLIYQFVMNGDPLVYRSYNITYVGEIIGEYQGSEKLFWGANATRYNFDTPSETWIIDSEWTEQTIGGGDDNYLFLRMDGPTNIIHPEGTNGSILNWNLAPIFGSVHGGYLDTAEAGDWWVKFSNVSTGQWIRIELEPNTGILLNVSFTQGDDVLMEYLINEDEFPPTSEDLIPKATFIANSTTIFEGEWIQFNFTGSPGDLPIDGQWYFGDGSANSTIENPTHQYTTAGTYTVTLTITDNDGDVDVYSMTITVKPTGNPTSSTSKESEEESGGLTPSFGISIGIIGIISLILVKKKH